MSPERRYPRPVANWSSLDEWWREVGEAELGLILWAAWDPIGCVPRDEYDWYVPRLWGVLRDHASVLHRGKTLYKEWSEVERDQWLDRVTASQARIVEQLSEWRTERIGLPPNGRDDEVIAQKLNDWLRPPGLPEFSPCDLAV